MAMAQWCGAIARGVIAAERRSPSLTSSMAVEGLVPILCGRGDKKTKRGKRFKGSYGNARPKKEKKIERIKDKIEVPRSTPWPLPFKLIWFQSLLCSFWLHKTLRSWFVILKKQIKGFSRFGFMSSKDGFKRNWNCSTVINRLAGVFDFIFDPFSFESYLEIVYWFRELDPILSYWISKLGFNCLQVWDWVWEAWITNWCLDGLIESSKF